jgi:hypothetical protein
MIKTVPASLKVTLAAINGTPSATIRALVR